MPTNLDKIIGFFSLSGYNFSMKYHHIDKKLTDGMHDHAIRCLILLFPRI